MSPFEFISIVIAGAALAISAWNYQKISEIESKNEYKSKNQLTNDVLSEAKTLIQKIIEGTDDINTKRLKLMASNSSYSGSYGASQGHEAILKEIRAVQSVKASIEETCEELKELATKDSKQVFDRCMAIQKELHSHSVEIVKFLGNANITINNMLDMSEQSNA